MLHLLAGNALMILGFGTLLWLYSVWKKDAGIVDPWWSILSLMVAARTVWETGLTPGKALMLVCVAIWALRLAIFLGIRCHRSPHEDPRYAAFRERYGAERYWWVSFFQVFVLQGVLALVASTPLWVAGAAAAPDPVSAFDLLGLTLFAVGFYWEAVGDAQLAAHRRNPAMKGVTLRTGVWRYTRHPNYFGEAVMAWGLWVMALDQSGGLFAVIGPAMMTFLLLRVSGVAMLEPMLQKTKPDYAAYVRATPAFFPWWPKEDGQEGANPS